jgi:HTH-type transcriptional regulator / antitoxin HigA
MITNQRQYLNTKAEVNRFRQALATPSAKGLHPKAAKAMHDGLQSQLTDLETEISEYEKLQLGNITALEANSIVAIGEALIKARIVRKFTQKDLADKLTLAEQQIQRYEATAYRGVSVERLQEVADALKLNVREVFTLEKM